LQENKKQQQTIKEGTQERRKMKLLVGSMNE